MYSLLNLTPVWLPYRSRQRGFMSLQKFSLCPLLVSPHPHPEVMTTLVSTTGDEFAGSWTLNRWNHTIYLYFWILLLIMFERCIHVVWIIRVQSFSLLHCIPLKWWCRSWLTPSADEHLGCSVLATMTEASLKILIHIFCWTFVFTYFGYFRSKTSVL